MTRFPAAWFLESIPTRTAAPLVAIANLTTRDFFSARVGCQLYQPVYGVDLAALCARRA